MRERCSVIIVNWNGRELLERALPSLPADLEVRVVDNGSTDDSVDWLKSHHPDVTLIEAGANLGFGRGNNLGLEGCTRDYVLLLNSDARLEPGALETALDWLEAHPQVGVVGAQLLHADGRPQHCVSPQLDLWTECLNRRLVAWWRGTPVKGARQPLPVDAVIGAGMLARRQALVNVSGFDPDYFFFLEETDLCSRLNRAGHEVWHHPAFRITHDQGQSASKRYIHARIEFHLSREIYFFKHFGRDTAKWLHNWQERRLWLTAALQQVGRVLSLGLWNSRRRDVVRALLQWYRLGCPENAGLRPEGWV